MKRCAIFAHYDKNGIVQEYVLYYLKELKKVAQKIVFVSDYNLSQEECSKIESITSYILAQRHGEYDFGSYKRGFFYALSNSLLENCDELILCNDSCYGPIYPFEEMFKEMDKRGYDFWGVTLNSSGIEFKGGKTIDVPNMPHIQSYFIVFKSQVFQSNVFANFLKNIHHEENKALIVIHYEIHFTELLEENGFHYGVYSTYSVNHPFAICSLGMYKRIVKEDRCPLIKTSTLRTFSNNKKEHWEVINNLLQGIDYDKNIILRDLETNRIHKKNSFVENIFSVKNDFVHKVITILGLRIVIKSKKLQKKYNFFED
ncbi:MAG TPA: hypothetical protein DDY68_06490 [Porphyromonadaceae bacterium]|nr:hypothetical protein [Porphyromonadaceae bacterium]